MRNKELASLLNETAVLLRLSGANDFKAGAYERSARIIENITFPIEKFIEEKSLTSINGIGKSLAEEIECWADTDTLPLLLKLKETIPAELIAWLNISGLGPKKAYKIHNALNITTLAELKAHCADGSVAALKGMGQKSADKILASIEWMEKFGDRCLCPEAESIAEPFAASLAALEQVQQLSVAGSLRRTCETIGDIDLLAAAAPDAAPGIIEAFSTRPEVTEVLGKGDTKCSVRTSAGRQVDLRVVSPEVFPAALMYFTGNKDHNVVLRQRARDRGLALNEYGLFKLNDKGDTDFDQPLPYQSEADLYQQLGLHFIPPELRESMGEVEFFETHPQADLVEWSDIRGILHAHSTWSDGTHTIEEMARACIERGFEYLGITDHSKSAAYAGGLRIPEVKEQWKEIEELNKQFEEEGLQFKIFKGIESDILVDGSLDYPNDILAGFDFIVASIHSSLDMPAEKMQPRMLKAAENPHTTMMGHPTNRLLLKRKESAVDLNELIEHAARHNTVIEINANPRRLDLDWRYGLKAKEAGLMTSLNPDAHHIEHIDFVRYGVNMARKAWFDKARVLNTKTREGLESWFEKKSG